MIDPRDTMTERLLGDAGIAPGMRVLDVGCGHGAVTRMLAHLVGPQGHVLGIDRDPAAVEQARERARDLPHVAFVESELGAFASPAPLDAIVGRRVLMYHPAPAGALRALARSLRPGGLVVLQEQDATMVPASRPPLPLHERIQAIIWQTVEREGANLHMGFDLPAVLADAGLELAHIRAEAVVQTPGQPTMLATIARAMLARIVQHGAATAADLDLDTLDQRLLDECTTARATYIGDMVFGAWARKPG